MPTLYRATTDLTARTGACFAESKDDARAYTSNPGFGGPNLAAYDVDDDGVLDCTDGVGALARAYAEATGQDAYDVREDWRNSGYGALVFAVLENVPGICDALAAAGYRWIRYEDDYPAGCITRMFIGDGSFEPAERL